MYKNIYADAYVHTGKESSLTKEKDLHEVTLCLYHCSISWATYHLNGQAANRTRKVHTDGDCAVGADGFSTVLPWEASGFTLRYVQQCISPGSVTTYGTARVCSSTHPV